MLKNNKRKTIHFNLIFRPEAEGGFTVIVPSLPGCISFGRDLKEAREMAEDAIAGYLQSAHKHGEKIIGDDKNFITTMDFELKKTYA